MTDDRPATVTTLTVRHEYEERWSLDLYERDGRIMDDMLRLLLTRAVPCRLADTTAPPTIEIETVVDDDHEHEQTVVVGRISARCRHPRCREIAPSA
jgi:hypothetical protein